MKLRKCVGNAPVFQPDPLIAFIMETSLEDYFTFLCKEVRFCPRIKKADPVKDYQMLKEELYRELNLKDTDLVYDLLDELFGYGSYWWSELDEGPECEKTDEDRAEIEDVYGWLYQLFVQPLLATSVYGTEWATQYRQRINHYEQQEKMKGDFYNADKNFSKWLRGVK